MIEYKEDSENKIVELIIDGKVTKADFTALAPKMEAFIEAHGKIKIIEILKNYAGFEPAMLIDGIKFDMKHLKDFSHCAVVTDKGWMGPYSRACGVFIKCEIRVFKLNEEAEARKWLVGF